MIEEIVNEISKRLISSTPSRYMKGFIGMGTHMEMMKHLLCLGSNEVRMVGIWGSSGIGKTTIARVIYDQISGGFQLSVFMTFKPSYARPTCANDHDEKLYLEQQFLSQVINQNDIKIPHLGDAQSFLMGKKVLVIFDGVEKLVQLDVMPQAQCLGPGSRIIITTQNLSQLNAFEIKHIYEVNSPTPKEALQIFCMSAFSQTSPIYGFEKLAQEVTNLAGGLPLGLRIMGSHFQGILSKQKWKAELPRLRVHLDGGIESILKLSYDALSEEDKSMFLHIACYFVEGYLNYDTFEDALKHKFSNVRQGLKVLVQRSLIRTDNPFYPMHDLLVQLGREIVRHQSIDEPGKRQFLVDAKAICEVLTHNTGSKSILGINLNIDEMEDNLCISEKPFEKMTNLQFLRFYSSQHKNLGANLGAKLGAKFGLPQGLKYLPPKLRILYWDHYPVKCLPSKFSPKFLVKLKLRHSNLEKLWKGIQPLGNLKMMKLHYSKNLKELPNLSTATNLEVMKLSYCSSLVDLPSSIENLTNLRTLDLCGCSNLMELPSLDNLTNINNLDLRGCLNLLKLPSSVVYPSNLTQWDQGHSKLQRSPFVNWNRIDIF